MSLKKKLLINLICFLPVIAIIDYLYIDKRSQVATEENYRENSLTQLDLIDDYLTIFFKGYMEDVARLAQSQDLINAEHDFPNYVIDSNMTDWESKPLSPLAQKVVASWEVLQKKDNYIDDIFVGFESGASYSISSSSFSGGFVGLARPWYIAGKLSEERSTIGTAYMSLSGHTVVPVVHKIFDTHNNFVGVLGIDISLTTVTEHLSSLNFGETGYIIVVDQKDKMLTNSRHTRNNFKFIKDLDNHEFRDFYFSDDIHSKINIFGSSCFVAKFKGEMGYTIISVIQSDEIMNLDYSSMKNTKLITMIFIIFISIAALFGIYFVRQMKD